MKQKPTPSQKIKRVFSDIGEIVRNLTVRFINPDARPRLRKLCFVLGRLFGTLAKIAATAVVIVLCTLTVVTLYGAIYVSKNLDKGAPVFLEEFDPKLTTKFYAADAESEDGWRLVETISGDQNRLMAKYEEIPQDLIDAVVAIEDKTYWDHEGVDWKRTVAAFTNMFLSMKNNFGGSTITQQLIKNTTGNDEVTVQRKFQEIFQALEFEQRYSKEMILENYLNYIFLGEMCYGVKTAAAEYFGKELSELTLLECACLAGITNNPYKYDPYINPKSNRKRTDIILREMYDQNYITEAEYTRAMSQKIVLARKEKTRETKVRSWYIEAVLEDLTADIMEKNGWSKEFAQTYVFSQGLSVYIQQDTAVQNILDSVWYDDANWPSSSKEPDLPESTMVIMDHNSGDIVALIGSRTPKTANGLENRATQTKRPPGSSIKPLSVYAPVFELGLATPYTTEIDAPISLNENGNGREYPLNSPVGYDGRMTLLMGLTKSKNTVSMRTLNKLTVETSRDFAMNRFHLSSIVDTVTEAGKIDGVASMSLGQLTVGVTVKEMAAAYSVFPTGGTYTKPRTYSRVLDRDGDLLMENIPRKTVAVKPLTAFYITTCLKNVVAAGTATHLNKQMPNMPVAGKTGTTGSDQDRWFAGYTSYYTAACWFGFAYPRSLKNFTGTNPALVMWTQVMKRVHEELPPRDFDVPPGLVTSQYCLDSGAMPSAACALDKRGSRVATGTFEKGEEPSVPCTMHNNVQVCTISGHLARPDCPEATRETKSLINDLSDRLMPKADIELGDEEFTMRWYGVEPYSAADNELTFAPLSNDSFFNTFCTVNHGTAPPASSPPDNPLDLPEDLNPLVPQAALPPEGWKDWL